MASNKQNQTTDSLEQLSLFSVLKSDPIVGPAPDDTPVTAHTTLSVARIWFRQYLIDLERPENTIESYSYDLVVMEQRISNKPLNRISESDIAMYLAEASSKVTRKRRLTSAKAFFRYLCKKLKILDIDPTESFSPHPLEHKLPEFLTADEQDHLMTAALADEPWSATAIWLMMRLGLGRTELLSLRRDHIDRTTVDGPDVLIAYDSPGKHIKQRTLHADGQFGEIYGNFLEQKEPKDVLFPYGPQAVNGMVVRVAAGARMKRKITPQILRHTAAVEMAKRGFSVNELLMHLGLANDARNRDTVRLYIEATRQNQDEIQDTT